jgi:ketosteroid isomerase-like protein
VTREIVDVVRRTSEAWEAGDAEAALALLDDDIEWHPASDEPETRVLRGKQAVADWLVQWMTAFEDFRAEALEFIDGGDCVVVPMRISGRLRGSGAEVENDETNVYWVRNGKIAEVREYRKLREALAAAGLAG